MSAVDLWSENYNMTMMNDTGTDLTGNLTDLMSTSQAVEVVSTTVAWLGLGSTDSWLKDHTETFWNITEGNKTVPHGPPPLPEWKLTLRKAYQQMPLPTLVLTMLSMGCAITFKEVWHSLRRPYGVIIGAISQFIIMPATAFGLAHALKLSPGHAIGLLIIGSCPGGTLSNVFTFLINGDISLSVCMTTVSTVLSLGMLPLNMFIYSRSWVSDKLSIPFSTIGIALASMLIPVIVGILINWKLPRIAVFITKVGTFLSFAAIIAMNIILVVLDPKSFTSTWRTWVGACVLPYIGLALGYLAATIFRLNQRKRRTIAIETGIQNIGLAIALLTLSFSMETHLVFVLNALTMCVLFGTAMNTSGFVAVGIYRLYLCCKKDKEGQEEDSDDSVMKGEDVEEHKAKVTPSKEEEVYGTRF